MSIENKRYITDTDPRWDFEVPEGKTNSMIDTHSRVIDNDWNFDEADIPNKEEDYEEDTREAHIHVGPVESGWDEIMKNS